MKYIRTLFATSSLLIFLTACETVTTEKETATPVAPKPVKTRHEPASNNFHLATAKTWFASADAKSEKNIHLVESVNRADAEHLKKMDSLVVPDDLNGDLEFYLPFPIQAKSIQQIPKIIFFSYPLQAFAAYENGELVYTGASNMGRKKDPTPAGLYNTNWKAEETTSTFNDEWELKWNFNIENKQGIGWHQYAMPGYPASHSCLRLLEKDAKYLYTWADEWKIKGDSVLQKGTPVIVYGTYNYEWTKPWIKARQEATKITEQELADIIQPYLATIQQDLQKQERKPK